jgi:hypothetical protein
MEHPPSISQVAAYNFIWEHQQQIGQGTEKKCRKLKMGADPWSPKLQLLRNTVNIWQLQTGHTEKAWPQSQLLPSPPPSEENQTC